MTNYNKQTINESMKILRKPYTQTIYILKQWQVDEIKRLCKLENILIETRPLDSSWAIRRKER